MQRKKAFLSTCYSARVLMQACTTGLEAQRHSIVQIQARCGLEATSFTWIQMASVERREISYPLICCYSAKQHLTRSNTRVYNWEKGTMPGVKMAWMFPEVFMDTLGFYVQTIMESWLLWRSFSKCLQHWSVLKVSSISNSQFCFSFPTTLNQFSC